MTTAAELPRPFWRVWTVVVVARSAQFIEPFLPLLILTTLAARPVDVAVALLAQQAAATVGFLAVGPLTRRLGVLRALRIGLAGAALASGVLAVAPTVAVVVPASALFGASSSLWRATAFAIAPLTLAVSGSTAAAEPRRRAFAYLVLASNAGAVLSAAAGAAGAPVRLLFAVQAVMTAMGLVLAVRRHGSAAGLGEAPGEPMSTPAPADRRRAQRRFWAFALAAAPGTALMFQAFSGLAVALPPDAYRTMVLLNATVLVVAQPVVSWVLRRVPASGALAVASLVLGAGIALHAVAPTLAAATVLWTLGELVVITVPSAVVAGMAPHVRVGSYVGRFQAVQGVVGAVAMLGGPVLAEASPLGFAAAAVLIGAAGVAGIAAVRRFVTGALDHPLACPCGAFLCTCGGGHQSCAAPTPILVHAATSRA